MTSVSVSIVVIPRDIDDAISIYRSLEKDYPAFQRIFAFSDRMSYELMCIMMEPKDSILLWDNCSSKLYDKIIENCMGEYITVIRSGERIKADFMGTMIRIQRNIGVDVVLSNFSDNTGRTDIDRSSKDDYDKIEVFQSINGLLTRRETTETQWVKFFRKSLLSDESISSISELSAVITRKAAYACLCHRKLFHTSYFDNIFATRRTFGNKWETYVGSLVELEDLSDDVKIHITIGICAYNEQYTIERTVKSIFTQYDGSFVIDKVIIVSSGSTDKTNDIIRNLSKENALIHPIFQRKREGKNSAVNEILYNSTSEVIVLYNADNVFVSEYTLDMLIRPFESEDVGMTGGHPIPTNNTITLPNYAVQMMWATHHNVSVQLPNMGELIAFRNTGIKLPTDMQGDEAFIRYNIEKKGLKAVYVPEATLYNKGPTTIFEFVKQRMRVNIGEENMSRRFGLEHSTHVGKILVVAMYQSLRDIGYGPFRTIGAVIMECLSRALAKSYVIGHKEDLSVWDQIKTTKKL